MRAAKANQSITKACNRLSALKVVIADDFMLWSLQSLAGSAYVRGRIRGDIAVTSAAFSGLVVDLLETCMSEQYPVTAQTHHHF